MDYKIARSLALEGWGLNSRIVDPAANLGEPPVLIGAAMFDVPVFAASTKFLAASTGFQRRIPPAASFATSAPWRKRALALEGV
jgi:hypothetical protein